MNTETRNCQNCKSDFSIAPDDFSFYEKIKVPPPTWCPECRLQRRLVWRNERTLYRRTCDLCGENMIAMYPTDTSFPVYCRSCWFSDKWDATQYGRDYDFSRPFFSQFKDLLEVVPQVALQVDKSVDCDYCNQITTCKNCYLLTSSSDCEDSMFSFRALNSKNVVDVWAIVRCENCYECLQSMGSSNMKFCEQSFDSVDVQFCFDVRGSQNCFMSSNLRNKKYVFRNQAVSKDEYKSLMSKIDTGSYANLERYRSEYNDLKLKSLHKFMLAKHAVNSSGDSFGNTKNCQNSFFISDSEDLKFCLLQNNTKDSYDVNNSCCGMEKSYEVSTTGVNTYNIKFSADIWPEAQDITYSQCCRNGSNNLFGCVGVRKKEYCILNKKYAKGEYEKLISQIIQHMDEMPYNDKLGRAYRYGEFFPFELSLFCYNESVAQDYLPVPQEKALELGCRWKAFESKEYVTTLRAESIPVHIKNINDDILNEIIGCLHDGSCDHRCTKAFRITKSELNLYRKMNIALPRLCPNCRHYERFRSRNPLKLWKRKCMCGTSNDRYKNTSKHSHEGTACPSEFETSYSPERPEVVYCDQCYNTEVA